jgi:GntR family transcriptional repressor for pyruvate dehydrogenase complex
VRNGSTVNSLADAADRLRLPTVKPAHEILADALRRQILLGIFPLGSRLPTERDLAPALGVSRNTARQAIKILAEQQLVRTSLGRNGGSVVTQPPTPARNRRAIVARWRDSVAENFEIRLSVEPLAAKWAAQRGTAAQRKLIARLGQTDSASIQEYHELESKWHVTVAGASRNPLLLDMVTRCREGIFEEANLLWIRSDLDPSRTGSDNHFHSFAEDHQNAAKAIHDQNPDAAAAAMREHLEESQERFVRMVDAVAGSI